MKVTPDNGPVDGRGAAKRREDTGVHIDAASLGYVQDLLGQDLSVCYDDAPVGFLGFELDREFIGLR